LHANQWGRDAGLLSGPLMQVKAVKVDTMSLIVLPGAIG
jgi:hypothetical protein